MDRAVHPPTLGTRRRTAGKRFPPADGSLRFTTMAKLSNVKPMISAAPSMLPRATDAHGHSAAFEPWRKWYGTARWQRLKRKVHERDGYVCQRSGVLCGGRGNDWNAPVANHIRAHRGDPVLFWDENNIETVTKQIHDSEIQREEARDRAEGRL